MIERDLSIESGTSVPMNFMQEERRSEARTTLVYRPVLIEADQFAGFCLLRNISPGGMMGVAYAQFTKGELVTVQFHPNHIVEGTISWSQDQSIGVTFAKKVDVGEVLSDLASTHVGDKINRAPRLNIHCQAQIVINNRTFPVEVQDISQRGVKIAGPFLRPEDQVTVLLNGMEPRVAKVRWTQNGAAGLNFVRTIAFEDLARWVIGLQSGSSSHD